MSPQFSKFLTPSLSLRLCLESHPKTYEYALITLLYCIALYCIFAKQNYSFGLRLKSNKRTVPYKKVLVKKTDTNKRTALRLVGTLE